MEDKARNMLECIITDASAMLETGVVDDSIVDIQEASSELLLKFQVEDVKNNNSKKEIDDKENKRL